MVLRFLTLLLAIVLMTGAAVQASATAATPSAVIDQAPDAPELDPLVVPECSAPAPIAVSAAAVTPASPARPAGRDHAVLVFRPPRLSASR